VNKISGRYRLLSGCVIAISFVMADLVGTVIVADREGEAAN